MSHPPQRDPRSVVTPDAYELSEALLGMPLASPRRRLAALLIDLLVIGFLTLVTKSFALVLGVVASIFFMRAGFKRTEVRRSVFNRAMRLSVGCFGMMIGLMTAILWSAFGFDFSVDDDDDEAPAAAIADLAGGRLAGALSTIATTAFTAELQSAQDLQDAESAMLDFMDAAQEMGLDREEILDLAIAAIPEGASWAEDAESAFAALAADDPDAVGEDSSGLAGPDPEAAAALELMADTLMRLQGRIGDLSNDLSMEERRRESLENELEEATRPGLFGTFRDFIDELGFGFGWASLYLTVFLSWWNGQTIGKRLMGVRVVRLDGEPITWWVAFERAGGYAAGFATGLLGFAQVWWDANRQGIHDRIVGTVVIREGAEKVLDWESAL